MDDVEIIHGDTESVAFGMGTYGSRSLAVGGAAIVKSIEKIIEKGKKIAAHKLEASADDIEFAAGKFTVKGTDKSVGFGDVALTAYVPHVYPKDLEPGLDFSSFYDPTNFTYPFGCHIAVVEVDKETGRVKLKRFVAVDDVGNVINPMIVEGQIHGGVVQGLARHCLKARSMMTTVSSPMHLIWIIVCRVQMISRCLKQAARLLLVRIIRLG